MLFLPIGCAPPALEPPPSTSATLADAPTWHQDVAPLVSEHCAGCHTEGNIAFPLDDPDAATAMAGAMAEATASGRMPPFGAQETDACTPPLPWKDDLRLSDEEVALLQAWAEAGAPLGDPAEAAPLPDPPQLGLEEVDATLEPVEPFVASGDDDQFVCFVIDPGWEEDVLLSGIQVQPGNSEVVHHVLLFSDPSRDAEARANEDGWYDCFGGIGLSDGLLLSAWAPGSAPSRPPEDSALWVEADSLLVMQVHYHPTGGTYDPDLTRLDLQFYDGFPDHLAFMALIGNVGESRGDDEGLLPGPGDRDGEVEFRIPAGAAGHTETMHLTLDLGDYSFRVFAAGSHMHYVGRDMITVLEHPEPADGEPASTCLVETPDWDFDWQRWYAYDAPVEALPEVRDGDRLWLQCTYDNTLDNERVAEALAEQGLDEPVDVYLGEETLDEMCLSVLGLLYTL